MFGPVRSRRLGLSLGVNILPADAKICSFNCIYCECGWNTPGPGSSFVPREVVFHEMEERFRSITSNREAIDVITFAGNGEPTLHPDFAGIMDDTLKLRDTLLPGVPVAVLSNSTLLHREDVRNALLKCDMPILKMDSAIPQTITLINNIGPSFPFESYFSGLKMMKGSVIQTLFLKGIQQGIAFNNSSDAEVDAWLDMLKEIAPSEVQIYTLHRVPPSDSVEAIGHARLKEIAQRLKNESINVHLVLN